MRRALVITALVVALGSAAAGSVVVVRARRALPVVTHATPAPAPTPASTEPPAPPVASDETDGTFVGVLLPPQAVNLATREDGKIVKIRVRVGDAVREGDAIAELDDRVKKHELAIARATLRAAQAQSYGANVDLDNAREKKARRTATVKVGNDTLAVVSGEEAANARFEERSAQSRLASAGANVHVAAAHVMQLEAEVEQLVLRAPFDGVVGARYADTGAFLHAGDAAVRVLGTGGLRVRLAVAEEDVPRLASRRRIEAHVDGATLRGKIEQIAPEVEPSSRTIFHEASVDESASDCGGDCARLAGRTLRVRIVE